MLKPTVSQLALPSQDLPSAPGELGVEERLLDECLYESRVNVKPIA